MFAISAPCFSEESESERLAINKHSALFSLLGTVYGGDGRTTFGLPDLRGRVPIGAGNGPGLTPMKIGKKGGSELSATGMGVPVNKGALAGKDDMIGPDTPRLVRAGGKDAARGLPPHVGMHYIIAINGVYPSRN